MTRHKKPDNRPPKEPAAMESAWLDVRAAAIYMQVSERQFSERLAVRPDFPKPRERPGVRRLWRRKDLDAWLDA